MAEPQSLANSQFTSLGSFNYNKILADDYCHKKLGTLKVKGASAKNASFNLKTNLILKNEKDGKKPALTDEYKFGFPYQRFYLQTRVKRNGEIKVHLDEGEVEILGRKFNIFSNVKTTVIFANYNARIGFNYFGQRCESNTRLERDNKGNHDFSERVVLTHGPWKYGFVGMLSLDNLQLKKYDSFVEYKQKGYELHLSHLSPSLHTDGLQLGKVSVGGLYRRDPSLNVALQFKRNFSYPKFRAVLGLQKTKDNLTFRAKCDNKFKISTAFKYKANPKLTLSLGTQFNFDLGKKFIDTTATPPLPIGFGVDIEA